MLNFLQKYQLQFKRTHAFCTRRKQLDLLELMQAQVTLPGGGQQGLTGFEAINRDRLKALDAEHLAELAKTDALELAYLHLQSLNNFAAMAQRSAPAAKDNN